MRRILGPIGRELIDVRDRARLVVGIAARLRRAELEGIDVEDTLIAAAPSSADSRAAQAQMHSRTPRSRHGSGGSA
ncbi:hypothetical protein [Sorangium cellulosum]|uniref:hypothetical protein n=1 Tax=Sorangium cellulosum TaxID=56 RepID=UPI0013313A74|nr:hypothetical protein [Sorangium cellulosum]